MVKGFVDVVVIHRCLLSYCCCSTVVAVLLLLLLPLLVGGGGYVVAAAAGVANVAVNNDAVAAVCASEQDFNNDDISRLKGRHEALVASREAQGKGQRGGEDFIPLDGKVLDQQRTMISPSVLFFLRHFKISGIHAFLPIQQMPCARYDSYFSWNH